MAIKIFKDKKSIEIIWFNCIRKYMIISEENISQQFKLKNIDEIRNYLIKEINQKELMSKKHKKCF